MESAIFYGIIVLIVVMVVLYIWYNAQIMGFLKSGPKKIEEETLTSIADKMHAAKAAFETHASILEKRLTTAKADVEVTTAKVVAAAAPKVTP